jgi:hypothetical protein
MVQVRMLGWIVAGLAALACVVLVWRMVPPRALSPAEFAERHAQPLPPPAGPLATYHLGHSLVGRDMPAMLAQLAGHDHASQLGWGATLKGHWEGDVPGMAEENAHPRFRPADQAAESGDYPVVVLTEMVELRDAVRFFDSPRHLANWARRFRAARPDARIYLYETWHPLDDPEGWLNRLDADLPRLWEAKVLRPAMAEAGVGTINVIPGGQVMAAAVRAIEAGQVPGLSRREDLFATGPDGTPDQIHFNDAGAYLMALAHYAVIYHRSPEGLPHALNRADGTPATALTPKAALTLQRMVWNVVTGYAATGVAGEAAGNRAGNR